MTAACVSVAGKWPCGDVGRVSRACPPLEDRQRRDGLRYDLMRESGELELHDGRLGPCRDVFLQAVVV